MITLKLRGVKWPTLNRFYAGMHWSKRAKLATQWHELVWGELLRTYGLPLPACDKPVVITVTGYAVHPPDSDGMAAAAKLVIDGLHCAGVLQDDTYKHVPEVRLRSRKADRQHPAGILVEVQEAA